MIAWIPNRAVVTVLGISGKYAHVQYAGAAGHLPAVCIASEETQGASLQMPVPEPPGGELVRARLCIGNTSAELTEGVRLTALSGLLTSREDYGLQMAGCPFGAAMTLVFPDGREAAIEPARDDCCVYRHNGHDFRHARSLWTAENGIHNEVLFTLLALRRISALNIPGKACKARASGTSRALFGGPMRADEKVPVSSSSRANCRIMGLSLGDLSNSSKNPFSGFI